jgi:hypothetical protein
MRLVKLIFAALLLAMASAHPAFAYKPCDTSTMSTRAATECLSENDAEKTDLLAKQKVEIEKLKSELDELKVKLLDVLRSGDVIALRNVFDGTVHCVTFVLNRLSSLPCHPKIEGGQALTIRLRR